MPTSCETSHHLVCRVFFQKSGRGGQPRSHGYVRFRDTASATRGGVRLSLVHPRSISFSVGYVSWPCVDGTRCLRALQHRLFVAERAERVPDQREGIGRGREAQLGTASIFSCNVSTRPQPDNRIRTDLSLKQTHGTSKSGRRHFAAQPRGTGCIVSVDHDRRFRAIASSGRVVMRPR